MVFPNPNSGHSPGRHQLPKELVDAYKRERVARVIAEAARDGDVKRLTVAEISKRAKMARNTFYELFDSREDAVRYAVTLGNGRLRDAIDQAADSDGGWEKRIKATVEALLAEAASTPALFELCLVQGSALAQPGGIPFDRDLTETLAGVLRAGRQDEQPGPGPRTEELLACGILSVVAKRLRRGEAETLLDLGPELLQIATLPFSRKAAPTNTHGQTDSVINPTR